MATHDPASWSQEDPFAPPVPTFLTVHELAPDSRAQTPPAAVLASRNGHELSGRQGAVRASHLTLVLVVIGAALFSGYAVWGTLGTMHFSSDVGTNLVGWTWAVLISWALSIAVVIWALVSTIRSAGARLLPAVAFTLSLILPLFAVFVGAKLGAELAGRQMLGDIERLSSDLGWMARLVDWLSEAIG